MNEIDLEILIPASPEFIWRFLGDLAAIPQWQEDVVSVSFLSTQREGPGTRWRQSTVKGSDVVVEISAWYDRLGYEYRIVDGSTHKENQGRVRLQEVTDGTLVRWTFQYEPRGVLGGIRNAMRHKRSATNQIQDSLRNLHQLIMQESGGISTHEARASMQEAPDVNERLSYQPRHPSAFHEVADDAPNDETSLSERLPLSWSLELESEDIPPVADTDTEPNLVVLGNGDELNSEAEPTPKLDDTRPLEVAALLAEIPPPEPEAESIMAEPTAREPASDPQPSLSTADSKPTEDSSKLSVFEIFGLQKPSEAIARADKAGEPVIERAAIPSGGDRQPASVGELQPGAPINAGRAEDPAAGKATICGWRRSARRKKALIRSHT